jgi:hypothetical protein
MLPPAPGLFSTMTCWENCSASDHARQDVDRLAGGEAHHEA